MLVLKLPNIKKGGGGELKTFITSIITKYCSWVIHTDQLGVFPVPSPPLPPSLEKILNRNPKEHFQTGNILLSFSVQCHLVEMHTE